MNLLLRFQNKTLSSVVDDLYSTALPLSSPLFKTLLLLSTLKMTSATSHVFKTLSIADSCGLSLPHLFTAKTPNAFLPIPTRPTSKFHLSHSNSSLFSPSLSLRSKTHFSSIVSYVAQTSDWAQQEEDSPIAIDGAEQAAEESAEEGVFEEREEEVPSVEPPEEAKIFVGNLPFDVDSQNLAELFEKAGVVEIAEVSFWYFFFLLFFS